MSEQIRPATLYVVSTPIGNLDDISQRALNILGGVDLIAAEDTRKTRILLDRYSISKPLLSYYSYNELRRIPDLLARLTLGSSVALVTDAGTPGISDPAFAVIRAAIRKNIRVVPVPGASALLPALIVSGLPLDRFVFEGFLPLKKGRKARLEQLRQEERTVVLYESPHRIVKTLSDLHGSFGDRRIAVVRELTKVFEEVFRGTIREAVDHMGRVTPRGEYVIVVAGSGFHDDDVMPRHPSTLQNKGEH